MNSVEDIKNNNVEFKTETKGIIISAFSCLGKSYLGQKYGKVLDLEASSYKWIYFDKELAKDIEKRKGVKDRIVNYDWPENYLSALAENLLKYRVILITPEKEIRKILLSRGCSYLLAYPTNPDFLVDRAIKRGNNIDFAEGLKRSFTRWYPDKSEKVLWINENEYLEDVLKKHNILNSLK